MSYLVDTNVLLRIGDEGDPRHAQCNAAIDLIKRKAEPIFVCTQVLVEFWVVLTRPREVNGWGLTFDEAAAEMADARASFRCLTEPPDMADRWHQVVIDNKTMGKQAHDARLATIMLAHGIERILTFNGADFVRYEGITPISPTDILTK